MPSLISITFDDGLRCQFAHALPILEQYRLPATFFLVANQDPILNDGYRHPDWRKTDWNPNDVQLFKNMVQSGHEIGAHSVHHQRRFLDRNPKLEAEGSKKWIEDRVGIEVSSYCYPFSYVTDPIRNAVVNAGFQQARCGANAVYYHLQDSLDPFTVDCRHIGKSGCDRVGDDFVGKYGAENVAGWLRPGCWHVLMFHGIGTVNDGWWPIPIVEFARQMSELAELRDSGAVEVVTFKQAAQMASHGRSSAKSTETGPGGRDMNVTVILCTYNRGHQLDKALDSLAASRFPKPIEWQILVVDNNSNDQTREVAEKFRLRDPAHFSYLFEPQQGLSYARNAGIREARGEILAFTDDDDLVDPDWLFNLTSAIYNGQWAGGGGRIIPVWPKPIPKWLSQDRSTLDGPYGDFHPRPEPGPLNRPPYGGNMAFRREVFEKYGGFRVDLGRTPTNLLGREDIEFGNRILAAGERLCFEPSAVTRSILLEERLEKNYALRWWYWYGRSEIADLGPPHAKWSIRGVPLNLFRKLARWSVQWLLSVGAARRFSAQRTVWYLAGTAVGCYQWSPRQNQPAVILGTPRETPASQTETR